MSTLCERTAPMRLELGCPVHCADGAFGELADLVVDPTKGRITHLVVEPHNQHGLARLVPVGLASGTAAPGRAVTLDCTVDHVRRLEPVHEIAFLQLGQFPVDEPDWDVGVLDVLGMPYYDSMGPGATGLDDNAVAYDRIPKGEVEIRRASSVTSSDGHHLGHVDGFVVEDDDDMITHVLLERGHLWGRREVTVPIGAVERVRTDAVSLSLSKDEVGALAAVPVRRRPG